MNAQSFYNQYWSGGGHGDPAWEWDEKMFRRVHGPLLGKERVLDYGCGLGWGYQRRLGGAVGCYVGADVAAVALADAQRKGFQTLRIDADKGTIDSADGAFDGATCIEVFEHLFDPLQSAREICRVLKPGGVLVATVPNFGYHAWRLLALLRAQVPSEPEDKNKNRYNGVHIRYFSKLMFWRLLRDAGFVNITIGSFDKGSVWDIFLAGGHLGFISQFARDHFPDPLHLRFLQDLWPNIFAYRLRAVGRKAA